MKMVNLCPHDLTIYRANGEIVTLPKSGRVARIVAKTLPNDMIDGIIVERVYRDEIAGLPDPQEGVVYIASAVIAADVRRPDVLSPGRLVRDDDGAVIGAAGLVRHND